MDTTERDKTDAPLIIKLWRRFHRYSVVRINLIHVAFLSLDSCLATILYYVVYLVFLQYNTAVLRNKLLQYF